MMGSIGPMRVKFIFFLTLILQLACQSEAPKTAPAEQKPIRHEIRHWQLNSQGRDKWLLSASLAQEIAQHWEFTSLLWNSPDSKIRLESPQAHQTGSQVFYSPLLTARAPGLEIKAQKAELNLAERRLQGKSFHIQGQTWKMDGQSFSAPLPLKKWVFKKVQASFQTGR
jgi:hypothetical protein